MDDGMGCTGKVELGVISITIEVNDIFVENITNGKEANDEEKGPHDKALGHTNGNKRWLGSKWFKLSEVSAAKYDLN